MRERVNTRIVGRVGPAEIAWREALAGWEIPGNILAQAPQPPWGFPPGRFAPPPEPVESVARRYALAALPEGGTVVDVGCGAGAASLALVAKVGAVIGVDERESMLDEFVRHARERDIDSRAVLGRWPDVAPSIEPVDVVVCHHVLYNVADIEPFVRALSEHARHRVVVEVTDRHPMAFLRPLWRRFWNLERPDGPSVFNLLAVLSEMRIRFMMNVEEREPDTWGTPDAEIALIRRRLCLPATRDAEIAEALAEHPRRPPRIFAIAWPAPTRDRRPR